MKKIKILHIEDDEEFSIVLQDILEDYNVENVTTGFEALNKLENQKDFNIIICDCRLPDTCGIELVKKIRKITDIPIIANSSSIDNNIDMCLAGANIFIPKDSEFINKFKVVIEKFKNHQSFLMNI